MPIPNATLFCRYHYDPLDRLVASTPSAQSATQRFYLKNRLATEVQGAVQRSIMQHEDQLLAQQQRQGAAAVETALLATDQQRSVLALLDAKRPHAFAYMPYGHSLAGSGLLSLLGFNGERPDPVTGWYLLGNGYRPFNPMLMCFTSPDSWSPFGAGGLNAYAYCGGDPVNRNDPNGHIGLLWRLVKNRLSEVVQMGSSQKVNSPLFTAKATKPPLATNSLSAAPKTSRGLPLYQTSGAPAGPPPRYTAKPSANPFSGKLQRDFLDQPPSYSSLDADTHFTGTFDPQYSPIYFGDVVPTPRPSRIQTRIDNLTREHQPIIDSIRDTPSEAVSARIQELETTIRQLRNDGQTRIGLPRYQK